MRPQLLISASLLSALLAVADASATCPKRDFKLGQLHVYTVPAGDNCDVSVNPSNAVSLTYRSYLFGSDGQMMVFESVPGPENTSDGSRAYFLFPRGGSLDAYARDGEVLVQTPSGLVFHFSPDSGHVSDVPDAEWSEDPSISMRNQGGFELTQVPGGVLDTGWKTGGAAYENPNGESIFRNAQGSPCSVRNSEIFDYGTGHDIGIRYSSDQELFQILSEHCH